VRTYDLIGTLGMVDLKKLQVRDLSRDMCYIVTYVAGFVVGMCASMT
jgi:hypothetical protein